MTAINKNEKQFNKIKKKNVGGSIIGFFFFTILAVFVIYLTLRVLTLYVVDAKLSSEFENVKEMARIYDVYSGSDHNAIYRILDQKERDFVIRNADGTIEYSKGDITFADAGHEGLLSSSSERIKFYTDTVDDVLYITRKNLVSVDFIKLVNWIRKKPGDEVIDTDKVSELEDTYGDDNSFSIFEVDSRFIEIMSSAIKYDTLVMPIWISRSVDNGNGELIVKAQFNVNTRDSLLILELISALGVLIAVILVVTHISTIRSFIRQRRITNLFFTDTVTKGNNWMCFLIKGGQLLRKRSNSRNKYAVLNVIFVKYRNYCVCHSIAEGEKMLYRVYGVMNGLIGRKEMCAHCTSSNFALLLKYNDIESLKNRVYDMIQHLERIDEGHKFSFQAGVSLIDEDELRMREVNLESEYNNACTARASMSESDDSGMVLFDEKFAEDQRWLDSVEECQAEALANEEFKVYYQPKYDPSTDKLRGAEALIRWESPNFGFVSPGKFIPIFEKNGFITEIDHYMISHVARDQKKWLDRGFNCVPVSVNVSRAHFVEEDLAEQIANLVDREGTPHEYIEIELTESAFFDDKKAMINTISKLQQNGFAVSMDDFGSGYSSLNSLKDMPLDVLKLDAEFFRGENTGDRGRIIVTEAIKIAKKLDMRTVAEGVEDRELVDFLASQGCDMIQGYYYAKPMPGNEYEERMKA
ncbi:MAG: EAL domain-containing protein [Lachnospiraceae bacterium]|nr:EAL domain-containing protein [Lachnospiraceae bacterium]